MESHPYKRRRTRVVYVGDVPVGGDHPIAVQSMTTTDTADTESTVDQIVRLVEAGCDIVRVTTQTVSIAANVANIKKALAKRGIRVPIVADVHFSPESAMAAAETTDKVRINPGNYADRKKFAVLEYSDEEYAAELSRIEERFTPLVLKCKERGVSMRIGTNHGSLSDRIMNRYGDTALGMVESALEFVRICEANEYYDLILSMKASNTLVMIQAYRHLAKRMAELGMDYPFHLGVTEAGNADEGRIKSAIGIGGLLDDGIGDTIRVSLTEDPVAEVPAGQLIAAKYEELCRKELIATSKENLELWSREDSPPVRDYERRKTDPISAGSVRIGGTELVRVGLCLNGHQDLVSGVALHVDDGNSQDDRPLELAIVDAKTVERMASQLEREQNGSHSPAFLLRLPINAEPQTKIDPKMDGVWVETHGSPESIGSAIEGLRDVNPDGLIVLELVSSGAPRPDQVTQFVHSLRNLAGNRMCVSLSAEFGMPDYRLFVRKLDDAGLAVPVILTARGDTRDDLVYQASARLGSLLCDGIGDAVAIDSPIPAQEALSVAYDILQGSRVRSTKTEFIACPSCGRTLFDLETTTDRIKAKTGHLKGVKIAIMGCIVNGLGEMADADFGYVGWGLGKINLFVGKECVERAISEEIADERLVELIKTHGMWVDPPGKSEDAS